VKRFGLIGDVHAEDERLATALATFAKELVDAVLCVGDLCDGEGDLDRCIALLEEHKALTVTGNHDRWLIAGTMRELDHAHFLDKLGAKTVEYIGKLPKTRRIDTAIGPLHLCHGLGKSDMRVINDRESLEFELEGGGYSRKESLARLAIDADTRIIVGGHTHRRWAADAGTLTMVNPGTLKRDNEPGFALLELDGGWRVRYFDLPSASTAVEAGEARSAR
jgi:predicted phosphodiesterase